MSVHGGPADWWTNGTDAGRAHIATKGTVQSGLVLNLDAGVSTSYPGTGTTWTDLSGNGNTGTLTNGPTFNSSNGGSIVFDGTNDIVSIGTFDLSSTNKISVDFFCKILTYTEIPGGGYILFESSNNFNSSITGLIVSYSDDSNGAFRVAGVPQYPINVSHRGNIGYNIQPFNKNLVNDLKWHHWCCIFDKSLIGTIETRLFIDGVEYSPSFTPSGLVSDNTNNFGNNPWYIGARANGTAPANFQLAHFKIYNRALTAAEIQQNFNAMRGRFGI